MRWSVEEFRDVGRLVKCDQAQLGAGSAFCVGEVELGRLLAGWVQVQPPGRDTMACRGMMRAEPESAVWWWEMSTKRVTERRED